MFLNQYRTGGEKEFLNQIFDEHRSSRVWFGLLHNNFGSGFGNSGGPTSTEKGSGGDQISSNF